MEHPVPMIYVVGALMTFYDESNPDPSNDILKSDTSGVANPDTTSVPNPATPLLDIWRICRDPAQVRFIFAVRQRLGDREWSEPHPPGWYAEVLGVDEPVIRALIADAIDRGLVRSCGDSFQLATEAWPKIPSPFEDERGRR